MFGKLRNKPPAAQNGSNGAEEATPGKEPAVTDEERLYLENLARMVDETRENGKALVDADLWKREVRRLVRTNGSHTAQSTGRRGDGRELKTKKNEPQKPAEPGNSQRKSYQEDPRYREYYDRLRKTRKAETSYEGEVKPLTLEQLEQQGWDGTTHGPASDGTTPPLYTPPVLASNKGSKQPSSPLDQAPGSEVAVGNASIMPGAIVQLDDGSVAIYRDAVSGKDYALFYFLESDGTLAPRGIFLEQYGMTQIGSVPPAMLEQLCTARVWDRDVIVFHLKRLEYAIAIRHVLSAQAKAPSAVPLEAKPKDAARPRRPSRPRPPQGRRPRPRPRLRHGLSRFQPNPNPGRSPLPHRSRWLRLPPRRHRAAPWSVGRMLKINVAGRIWESVYWTSDEIGPIVAHDTNREWALMHLDLSRFGDAIEYGEVLDATRLAEIGKSLSRPQ